MESIMTIYSDNLSTCHLNCIINNPHTKSMTILSRGFMNRKNTHRVINIFGRQTYAIICIRNF